MPLGKFGNMYPLYINSTSYEGFNNINTSDSQNIIDQKRKKKSSKVDTVLSHVPDEPITQTDNNEEEDEYTELNIEQVNEYEMDNEEEEEEEVKAQSSVKEGMENINSTIPMPFVSDSIVDTKPVSNSMLMNKLKYMINLIEQQQDEKTDNVFEEVVLYCLLGIFIIFISDSFVKVGKYIR